MKLSIQYIDNNNQKFCFVHAVKIVIAVDGWNYTKTEIVESDDKVECLICSGEISMDDILGK